MLLLRARLEEARAATEAAAAALVAGEERVAEQTRLAGTVLSPLPQSAVDAIFLLVPVATRLRCREVSRSWRAHLEERRFWRTIVHHPRSHGLERALSPALLLSAVARAGGQLESLNVWHSAPSIRFDVILAVANANSGALRTLSYNQVTFQEACQLAEAAPQLHELRFGLVSCSPEQALRLLRGEAPLGSLRARGLTIRRRPADVVDMAALSVALRANAHPLGSLTWHGRVGEVAALTELCAACVAMKLPHLVFGCGPRLERHHLPALSLLLLPAATLQILTIHNAQHSELFAGPDLPAFCDALRASQLTQLTLACVNLWATTAHATQLLSSLEGHPTLTFLNIYNCHPPTPLAQLSAGASLAALISADSALTTLVVESCGLGVGGCFQIFQALRSCRKLRHLHCMDVGIDAECAREHILPAVQANTSLVELVFYKAATEAELRIPALDAARDAVKARLPA